MNISILDDLTIVCTHFTTKEGVDYQDSELIDLSNDEHDYCHFKCPLCNNELFIFNKNIARMLKRKEALLKKQNKPQALQ